MGIFQTMRSMFSRLFRNDSGVASPAQWLIDWFRGSDSESGVEVTPRTALTYAPIWYAVNKIAGHVGQLPIVLYRELDERNKEKAKTHPSYWVMKVEPNSIMSPMTFKETITAHALLWGNGRAAISRNNRGDVIALHPLNPSRTVTVLVNGEKWHVVTNPENGQKTRLHDREVLHIAGLSDDGISGLSVIECLRNSVGLGLAGENQASRHFKNNSTPGLILEAPIGTFKKEDDARKFLADWNKYHSGLENANKTALLRDGIKANPLSVNARDSQWIEQRKFQRQEAALWMALEQILGDDSSVSYNSLEQKNMAYLTNCLMRWLTKWEQECTRKLLTERQKLTEAFYFKFITAALLRGTTKERYEVYQIGRMIGVLSSNDVRSLEDMPPIPDGDRYDNPSITVTQPVDQPIEDVQEENDTTQSRQTTARERMLVASRLKELITVETHRITTAAAKERNFLNWMDSFYSTGSFGGRIAKVYEEIGASHLSESHIDESRQILLNVADTCTADNFVQTIDSQTQEWHKRADAMTELVLNCEGV